MKKHIIIVMILTVIAKITGFIREIVLSYYYGATSISDAFLVSLTIPTVIFGFITAGIITGYIPMYNKIMGESSEEEANKFTNNLINFVLLLSTVLIILVLLFTEQIVKGFAIGFNYETLRYTIKFTRIMSLVMYFSGVVAIYVGFLQIKNSFVATQLISIPSNCIWVIGIYLASRYSDLLLPWGAVISIMAQVIFLLPWIKKNGLKYKLKLNLKDKYLKDLIALSIPIIIGVSVNQINTLVDRSIASTFGAGGITALSYASKLNVSLNGLFVISIITVLYPKISQLVVKDDKVGIVESLREAIIIINMLVIPITMINMVFSNEIIAMLFGRGAFTGDVIHVTGRALFYYSIGIIGFGLTEILGRIFYAYQDNRTPMINAVIGVMINVILNIILSRYMGLSGLALATSISAIVTTVIMGITLRKKIGSFGIKDLTITTLKIVLASLIMGATAKLFFNYSSLKLSNNFSLLLSLCVGGMVYIISILFMRIKDVDSLVEVFNKKIRNRK